MELPVDLLAKYKQSRKLNAEKLRRTRRLEDLVQLNLVSYYEGGFKAELDPLYFNVEPPEAFGGIVYNATPTINQLNKQTAYLKQRQALSFSGSIPQKSSTSIHRGRNIRKGEAEKDLLEEAQGLNKSRRLLDNISSAGFPPHLESIGGEKLSNISIPLQSQGSKNVSLLKESINKESQFLSQSRPSEISSRPPVPKKKVTDMINELNDMFKDSSNESLFSDEVPESPRTPNNEQNEYYSDIEEFGVYPPLPQKTYHISELRQSEAKYKEIMKGNKALETKAENIRKVHRRTKGLKNIISEIKVKSEEAYGTLNATRKEKKYEGWLRGNEVKDPKRVIFEAHEKLTRAQKHAVLVEDNETHKITKASRSRSSSTTPPSHHDRNYRSGKLSKPHSQMKMSEPIQIKGFADSILQNSMSPKSDLVYKSKTSKESGAPESNIPNISTGSPLLSNHKFLPKYPPQKPKKATNPKIYNPRKAKQEEELNEPNLDSNKCFSQNPDKFLPKRFQRNPRFALCFKSVGVGGHLEISERGAEMEEERTEENTGSVSPGYMETVSAVGGGVAVPSINLGVIIPDSPRKSAPPMSTEVSMTPVSPSVQVVVRTPHSKKPTPLPPFKRSITRISPGPLTPRPQPQHKPSHDFHYANANRAASLGGGTGLIDLIRKLPKNPKSIYTRARTAKSPLKANRNYVDPNTQGETCEYEKNVENVENVDIIKYRGPPGRSSRPRHQENTLRAPYPMYGSDSEAGTQWIKTSTFNDTFVLSEGKANMGIVGGANPKYSPSKPMMPRRGPSELTQEMNGTENVPTHLSPINERFEKHMTYGVEEMPNDPSIVGNKKGKLRDQAHYKKVVLSKMKNYEKGGRVRGGSIKRGNHNYYAGGMQITSTTDQYAQLSAVSDDSLTPLNLSKRQLPNINSLKSKKVLHFPRTNYLGGHPLNSYESYSDISPIHNKGHGQISGHLGSQNRTIRGDISKVTDNSLFGGGTQDKSILNAEEVLPEVKAPAPVSNMASLQKINSQIPTRRTTPIVSDIHAKDLYNPRTQSHRDRDSHPQHIQHTQHAQYAQHIQHPQHPQHTQHIQHTQNTQNNMPQQSTKDFILKKNKASKINRIIDELYFREKKFVRKGVVNETIMTNSNIFDLNKAITMKNAGGIYQCLSTQTKKKEKEQRKAQDLSSFIAQIYPAKT